MLAEWQTEFFVGPLSVELSFFCGQAFRWVKSHESFIGVVGPDIVEVRESVESIQWRVISSKNPTPSFDAIEYFSLDVDFNSCLEEITKDEIIKKAVNQFSGLRVLRQDPWEVIISYLCSANAPVFRIRRMIEAMSQKWGERIAHNDSQFSLYRFPRPPALAKADLQELRDCGVGFRDKRIVRMAQKIVSGEFNIDMLKGMPYLEARACLLKQYGIGPKIADCICAFGLGQWEAFPTDVWIRRIIQKYYLTKQASSKDIATFGREYFGRYAAIAQEYLFHFARTSFSTQKPSV